MDFPEQVRVLINYMLNAGEAPAPEFMRALAERLPQHEDELMTIAQQLEQIGIEKGLQQGLQLGEQRGIEKAAMKANSKLPAPCSRTVSTAVPS